MWYNIRQRFSRERRKVVASAKGKSGQEAKPLYVPKWSLYHLCLFLVDHIMPRKTTSNYRSDKKKTKTAGETSFSPVFILSSSSSSPSSLTLRSTSSPQAFSPQALSSQATSTQIPSPQMPSPQTPSPQAIFPQTMFDSPSNVWSSDLESTCNNDGAPISSIEDKKKDAIIHASTSSPSSLNVKGCFASVTTPSSSEEILKEIQKTSIKRTVPKPDHFAKYRKKEDDLFMQAIAKQSTALTNFATKLEESLVNRPSEIITNSAQSISHVNVSSASSALSVDDPVLIAIGYALKSVAEEKHLEYTGCPATNAEAFVCR